MQIVYPEVLSDAPEQDFTALDQQLLAILRTVRFSHLMHPSCYTAGNTIVAEDTLAANDRPAELQVERNDDSPAIEITRMHGLSEGEDGQQHKNSGDLHLSMVKDWSEVLSGGEKQRLSLARCAEIRLFSFTSL